uniref:Retrotransposon gag domain-containing protein n=1 Tax=Tanacetum cinerariifolium TaxID=118510 RepID=A0A699RSG0_TANCI|nr:hypothetical protein [Tanacetum cinerariifolium]
MPWTEMKQLMTAEFCPIEEVQRMEHKLWSLKIKEYNILAYNQRFNELALMCPRMIKPERVKVDAYIRGLSGNIKGEVTSSKPANPSEAENVEAAIATERARHANVVNDARGYGPVRGQDAALAARECTFAVFIKCDPTAFLWY